MFPTGNKANTRFVAFPAVEKASTTRQKAYACEQSSILDEPTMISIWKRLSVARTWSDGISWDRQFWFQPRPGFSFDSARPARTMA